MDTTIPGSDAEIARHFDLRALPDSFYDDPYPTYAALRRAAPVLRLPDGSLFLTRYADVQACYRDPALFTSDKTREFGAKFGPTPLGEHHTTSLVFNDPPRHTRVRRLIMGALTVRAVAAMEPDLVRLVDALLDRAAALGRLDLVEDFAAAIPVEVIGNLLAVPHEERGPLRAWSLAILGALEPAPSPAQLAAGNQAVEDFVAYLRTLVAERRRRPGDPAHDVLTRLILGGDEGDERLGEAELLHNCIFLLNAGHETTTNLIANALVLLCRFPAERARLLAEPALIRTAVEEALRYESSNQLGNRALARDAEIAGTLYPAGTGVTLGIGAANRDPAVFPDPDRFDSARDPNRHLAFAFGIHQCAGLSLARLEARVAIG
ncbi:MAG: cytochrome P450, partial [Acetobacteraceae bacterium]|nr:cytochrome P450 [Acetobacteraceae bacterium]